MRDDFEVSGVNFQLSPLKLKQALKGQHILLESILPAIAGAANAKEVQIDLSSAVQGLARLPELIDVFLGACRVQLPQGWVDLYTFREDVFRRKPTLLLAWLVQCLEIEYGDFLADAGRDRLTSMGTRFESLISSIGGSGESPPTPESKTP